LLTDSQFFLDWLPAQLQALDLKQRVPRPVSLVVQVAEAHYCIDVEPSGATRVTATESADATFRLRLDQPAFTRLLLPVTASAVGAVHVPQVDAETLDLVCGAAGCLEASFDENGTSYTMVFGPGPLKEIGCKIHCDLADFERVRAGSVQPFELLMNGKLRIEGDPQIALALGSLLM
jgi:hypothetical protein